MVGDESRSFRHKVKKATASPFRDIAHPLFIDIVVSISSAGHIIGSITDRNATWDTDMFGLLPWLAAFRASECFWCTCIRFCHWLTASLTVWLTRWMIAYLIDWMITWLSDGLFGWLTDRLTGWLNDARDQSCTWYQADAPSGEFRV